VNRAKGILIVGGSGALGTHLALALRDHYKVYSTYHKNRIPVRGVTQIPLNVENRDWAKRVAYMAQPEVVIYVAGSNTLPPGEVHARNAEHVHASGAATISMVSDILQPVFIYLSNSYVFDGSRGNYHETDTTVPSNALGKAKLSGENFIRSRTLNYVIIRSAPLLMRGNGYNLSQLDQIRMTLDAGKKIELSNDELHNFASVHGLLDLVRRVIETGVRKKVFHYGGLTKVTPYDMARSFAEKLGYDPRLVFSKKTTGRHFGPLDVPSEDYSLNFSQTVEGLKIKPLFLEEGLDLINQDLVTRT